MSVQTPRVLPFFTLFDYTETVLDWVQRMFRVPDESLDLTMVVPRIRSWKRGSLPLSSPSFFLWIRRETRSPGGVTIHGTRVCIIHVVLSRLEPCTQDQGGVSDTLEPVVRRMTDPESKEYTLYSSNPIY